MTSDFTRTIDLIGRPAFEKLQNSSVCVFGCGGVGSYVVEALARSGVGRITIVDNDVIDRSNINRQLIALNSTVCMPKAQAAAERVADINPDCVVTPVELFFDSEHTIPLDFDYIADAIDSVPSKLFLIEEAAKWGVPVISAMGTGNKLNPSEFEVSDISKTSYCPLAKKMRCELRKRGINHLKVVYSREEPAVRAVPPASISFVPGSAGLLMAGEIIKDLIK